MIFLVVGLVLMLSSWTVSAKPLLQGENSRVLSFSDLGIQTQQTLNSPFDELKITFSLPLAWEITNSSELTLNLEAIASSLLVPEQTQNLSEISLGEFSVWLDGQSIYSQMIQQTAAMELKIPLSPAQFHAQSPDRPHDLVLRWDARTACNQNMIGNLVVFPTSTLLITYLNTEHTYALADFPAPFYQEKSLDPQEITIILPPEPRPEELQAALIVAAGLGRLSHGDIQIQYQETDHTASITQNAILIARQDRIWKEILAQAGSIQVIPAQGQIELISPFRNQQHALLLTGTDANGLILAAKALSQGAIPAPSGAKWVTIASAENPAGTEFQTEETFAQLGSGDLEFDSSDQKVVTFSIPSGIHISEGAYVDLFINHSQLLDYLSSGLKIVLNDVPLGNIRLSDVSSNYNQLRLMIPSSILRTGSNRLAFEATLSSRELCGTQDKTSLWLTVFSNSKLYLPLGSTSDVVNNVTAFGDFPSMFLTSPGLDDVAFVIPDAPSVGVPAAIQLAYTLGSELQGNEPIGVQLLSPDKMLDPSYQGLNLIIVGKPSSFPALADSSFFPQIKFDGQDSLAPESQVGMVLVWQSGEPQGVMAVREMGNGRTALAILGNGTVGIDQLAVKAIAEDMLKGQDFAVVTEAKLFGANIIFNNSGATSNPSIGTSQNPVIDGTAFLRKTALWAIPLIVVSILLILILLFPELRNLLKKKR